MSLRARPEILPKIRLKFSRQSVIGWIMEANYTKYVAKTRADWEDRGLLKK
jgi:hypothetical protein